MKEPDEAPKMGSQPARPPRRGKSESRAILAQPEPTGKLSTSVATVSQPSGSRFRIFVIDTGWKSPAAQILRANFSMILTFQDGDPFYVLTRKQSQQIVHRNPVLMGKDPIILVRDLTDQPGLDGEEFHGFHLNLGLLNKPTEVLGALREFLQFLKAHRNSPNIEMDIREKLHRDGFIGTLQVIRAGAQEALGG